MRSKRNSSTASPKSVGSKALERWKDAAARSSAKLRQFTRAFTRDIGERERGAVGRAIWRDRRRLRVARTQRNGYVMGGWAESAKGGVASLCSYQGEREHNPETWSRLIADRYSAKCASHELVARQRLRLELWESAAEC